VAVRWGCHRSQRDTASVDHRRALEAAFPAIHGVCTRFLSSTRGLRGNYEAIYGNMPVFGLAMATEHVRAVGGRETARRRLMRGENEPAVPSPE
jgi:hypothetical protein